MIFINDKLFNPVNFPDGTKLMRSPIPYIPIMDENIDISWFYDSDDELFQIQCIVDYLADLSFHTTNRLNLFMPYIPNARMDRVKVSDEIFSLKSFAKIINYMIFDNIVVVDPHSNVSEALFNRLFVISVRDIIKHYLSKYIDLNEENLLFFFPDEGAVKKYSDQISIFGIPYIYGIKKRDWRSGKITGLEVRTDTIDDFDLSEHYHIVIIDDICSKGGTFYHSAVELKKIFTDVDIDLYVSHLENSVWEGEMINSGLINHIYTTCSIYRKSNCDKVTIITDDKNWKYAYDIIQKKEN